MVKKQSENKYDLANLKGVGPVTVEKFKNAGINDMLDLVNRSTVELEELTGMEKETVLNVMSKTRAILVEQNLLADDFINAEEVVKIRANRGIISTGTESLNGLFDGGVETQAITEVYGEFGCGKTQFAHTLAVIVQQDKEHGGLEGNVLYLDTEGTFRPERIKSIAVARGFDPDKCIKGITVARAINSAHQMSLLEHCGKVIQKNSIKLLVVDSVSSLYRSEYFGRGTLAPRQQGINKFLKLLHRISETYNLAAIVTNQVLSNPGQMFGDPTKPVGGHIVGHSSTYRVYFMKSGRKRIAKMIDSPSHANKEALFDLGNAGVIDLVEAKKKKEEIEE